MNKQSAFSLSLLIASTAFLPQCDMFKSTKDKQDATTSNSSTAATGETLITVNGKVVATVNDFNTWLERFFSIQPQYKQFVEMQPELKKNLAESFLTERVLTRWIVENGVDKTAEYQKDLADIQELAKQQLAGKYFQQKFPADITDAEVRKYYEENKQMPGIRIAEGGVTTQAVKFNSEADAKVFLEAVKNVAVDFEKAAKDKNLTVKNYREVHDKRFDVAEPVRMEVLKLTKFPSVTIVKVDDKNWEVIKATKKEDAQYVPFEQVKEQVEGFLKQQKMQKMFEFDSKELQDIRKALDVQVNTDALERISGQKKDQAEAQAADAGAKMAEAYMPEEAMEANAVTREAMAA